MDLTELGELVLGCRPYLMAPCACVLVGDKEGPLIWRLDQFEAAKVRLAMGLFVNSVLFADLGARIGWIGCQMVLPKDVLFHND
ncbi:unnamed protein product [Protopolystoma xenopodis]|uniref:Uncharacterized protein n=1 Tax=Protopolystoma xenopodis TaxID=117903 RepID=A0A3S5ADA5_9PLAT|nr:unnamed protein product [Protopolystoma xenopodis]